MILIRRAIFHNENAEAMSKKGLHRLLYSDDFFAKWFIVRERENSRSSR